MFGLESLIKQFNRLVKRLERHADKKTAEAQQHRQNASSSTVYAGIASAEAGRAQRIATNVRKLIEA